MATATQTETMPFLRQLASSDSRTRAKALEDTQTYLRHPPPLDELALLKLWKGLFYTMYHADRPLPQQRLAHALAALPTLLPSPTQARAFAAAFWSTLAREWPALDALRLNKFMLLARLYVRRGLALAREAGWSGEAVTAALGRALGEGVPAGLVYHVLDVFVDEMVEVGVEGEGAVEAVLDPVRGVRVGGLTKALRGRAGEVLGDARLEALRGGVAVEKKGEEEQGEEEEFEGFGD